MVSAIGRGIMAVFSGIASILNAIVSVRLSKKSCSRSSSSEN